MRYVATKKVFSAGNGDRSGVFQARVQAFHPGFHPGSGHTFRLSPCNHHKTFDLGQPKARYGFSSPEIGREGVDTPSRASGGCPLGLVGGQSEGPTDPRLSQPTLNRPNQRPTDSVHTAPLYFEGAESIYGPGLPQFLDFGPGSGAIHLDT